MAVAKEVMYWISTNGSIRCPLCDFNPPYGPLSTAAFAPMATHIMEEHGLPCLHVGQETEQGSDGPVHATVAVFGK